MKIFLLITGLLVLATAGLAQPKGGGERVYINERSKNNLSLMTVTVLSPTTVDANPGYQHVEKFRIKDIDTIEKEYIENNTHYWEEFSVRNSNSFNISMIPTSGTIHTTYPPGPVSYFDASGDLVVEFTIITRAMEDPSASQEIYYDELLVKDTTTDPKLKDPDTESEQIKVIIKPNVS